MRPDTIFNYIDESTIQQPTVERLLSPIYLTAFSSDKGPESITRVDSSNFYKLYGSNISFEKHGQPLLQAANIIDNGGMLFAKRVVAPDATLANASVVAHVKKTQVQKLNAKGVPLYVDAVTGQETIVVDGNEPLMINNAEIRYDIVTVPEVKTATEIKAEVGKMLHNPVTEDEDDIIDTTPVSVNGTIELASIYGIPSTGTVNAAKTSVSYGDILKTTLTDEVATKLGYTYGNLGLVGDDDPTKDDLVKEGYFVIAKIKKPDSIELTNDSTVTISYDGSNPKYNTWEQIKNGDPAGTEDSIIQVYYVKEPLNKVVRTVKVNWGEGIVQDFSFDFTNAHLGQSVIVDEPVEEEEFVFPFISVWDNGRGSSNKRFNVVPDYSVSKNMTFQYYTFTNVENTSSDEYVRFAADPDLIYAGHSTSLTMTSKGMSQLNAHMYEECIEQLITKIAEITGLTEDYIKSIDVFFGCNRKGESLGNISVDTVNGYDLKDSLGINLMSGSDGSFGNRPFGTDPYTAELVKFFNGSYDDSIFDLNRYQFAAVFDANYPVEVKNTIDDLALFREDFFFFKDIGLDNNTYEAIIEESDGLKNTKFSAVYINSYDIIDPYGRKQIPVTITYSLARIMLTHFIDRINCPTCGIKYGFVIPEAIEGTVNFCPKITPTVDQKTMLSDACLNYASYINDVLTVETEYTCQTPYTQFSFINNIILVQDLIRYVRKECPKYRYTFITTNDLDDYRRDVEGLFTRYNSYFDSLAFKYTRDDIMAANKIFQASIEVTFKNFEQTEIFKIYAMPTTTTN